MKSYLVKYFRLFIGAIFILSGVFKIMDPIGSSIVFNEYLNSVNLEFLKSLSIPIMGVISLIEFILGATLFVNLKARLAAKLALYLLLLFTALTLLLVIFNPVSDCGCFGEVIKLTNWQTFTKNIVLLALAFNLFIHRDLLNDSPLDLKLIIKTSVLTLPALMIFFSALLGVIYVDNTKYNISKELVSSEVVDGNSYLTTIVYKKDGLEKSFQIDDLPDSTWQFVRTETVQENKETEEDSKSLIFFSDYLGNDVTESIVSKNKRSILVTIVDCKQLTAKEIESINRITNKLDSQLDPNLYIVTSSFPQDCSNKFSAIKDASLKSLPILSVDIKSVLALNRFSPGVVTLNGGVVIGKSKLSNYDIDKNIKDFFEDSATISAEKILKIRFKFWIVLVGIFLFLKIFEIYNKQINRYLDASRRKQES